MTSPILLLLCSPPQDLGVMPHSHVCRNVNSPIGLGSPPAFSHTIPRVATYSLIPSNYRILGYRKILYHTHGYTPLRTQQSPQTENVGYAVGDFLTLLVYLAVGCLGDCSPYVSRKSITCSCAFPNTVLTTPNVFCRILLIGSWRF